MKKVRMLVLNSALFLGIILSGTGCAAGPPDHPPRMGGPGGRQGGGDPMLLARAVQKNIMAQALSQLTGQPADSLEEKLKERQLPALLDEYRIDRKAFHDAMRVKMSALVRLLTGNGYLSETDGEKVLEQSQEGDRPAGRGDEMAKRREIMSRLIKKGLADGTITRQEAELLRPPRE
jgi:hypothetical protein